MFFFWHCAPPTLFYFNFDVCDTPCIQVLWTLYPVVSETDFRKVFKNNPKIHSNFLSQISKQMPTKNLKLHRSSNEILTKTWKYIRNLGNEVQHVGIENVKVMDSKIHDAWTWDVPMEGKAGTLPTIFLECFKTKSWDKPEHIQPWSRDWGQRTHHKRSFMLIGLGDQFQPSKQRLQAKKLWVE